MSLDKVSVLLADDLHFHERNFKSLFDFFQRSKIKYDYAKIDKSWLSLYGNYYSKRKHLNIYYDLLDKLTVDELFDFKINDCNVFEIVRSELLSYLIPKPEWINENIYYNKTLFLTIIEKNKDDLLLNMAAACYWFDFWEGYLNSSKVYTYCCIFSGCLIYTKVLKHCLKTRVTDPLLFEMSLTGKDYYCENHYGVIPNKSIVGFNNYYNNIELDFENYFQKKKIQHKALNKLILMDNKNVKQPDSSDKIDFKNSNDTVLIIGQVINDFSILESDLTEYNSLILYKTVINKILNETDLNIVFKAHPWECNKINIYKSLTKDTLESFISDMSEDFQKRIKIVENYNLKKLFNITGFVITLCSQGAIEAAFNGVKCIQLGNAFYGRKGFTYDCGIDDFIDVLLTNDSNLTLNEFENFNNFLIKYLIEHLVSIHGSGLINLRKIFEKIEKIPLVSASTRKVNDQNDIKKEIVTQKNQEVVKKIEVIKKPKEIIATKKTILDVSQQAESSLKNELLLNKKLSKLIYNPERFFNDSKYVSLRKIGHIYKAFKQN